LLFEPAVAVCHLDALGEHAGRFAAPAAWSRSISSFFMTFAPRCSAATM
jgi:hypothetical protein